jgi:hypothetical protein
MYPAFIEFAVPRKRRALTLAALLLTVAAPLAAQGADEIRAGVAAGTSLSPGRSDLTLALLGSLDVRRAGTGLGVRAELLFTDTGRDDQLYPNLPPPCIACDVVYPYDVGGMRERRFGLLLGATYQFRRAERVRPYLLSGLGVYHTRRRFREVYYIDTCPVEMLCTQDFVPPLPERPAGRSTDLGMHAGIGTTVRIVSRLELFAEARFHLVDEELTARRFAPLTLGLRF